MTPTLTLAEICIRGYRQMVEGDRVIEAQGPHNPSGGVTHLALTVSIGGYHPEAWCREFVPANGEWWAVADQPAARVGRLVRVPKCGVVLDRVLVVVPVWEHPDYDPRGRGQRWE